MNKLKDLLTSLIACASVTPDDSGCQEIMITWLERLGFKCQRLNNQHVSNFYAQIGTQGPLLLFAGHTDVVPAGDLGRWHSPPFELHEHNGCFYGRGVADMKGSLACMLLAAERWIEQKTQHNSRLGFLITSGEEGDDFELGTPYVMQYLSDQGIHPDFCIVGEPSSMQDVGDMIRIGRRGSLTAHIRLNGFAPVATSGVFPTMYSVSHRGLNYTQKNHPRLTSRVCAMLDELCRGWAKLQLHSP